MWRPSRQARSFEGSGHLGPDDRARVQLESARLGVPATRRASAFRCVTRRKTPPKPGLTRWTVNSLGERVDQVLRVNSPLVSQLAYSLPQTQPNKSHIARGLQDLHLASHFRRHASSTSRTSFSSNSIRRARMSHSSSLDKLLPTPLSPSPVASLKEPTLSMKTSCLSRPSS